MPMIRVQLSSPLDKPKQASLMSSLSAAVAAALGKPEGYMMVVLQPDVPILMGGRHEPAAFVEVRSVGSISSEQAVKLSEQVSAVLGKATGLAADHIYSNFAGVAGAMWGHDGSTFG
jgi:phenylpyruvate tautomerase